MLRVFHIGTNSNVADFFTKPLIGEKFAQFRSLLMGYEVKKDHFSLFLNKLNHCFSLSSISPIPPNPSCVRCTF